MTAEPKPGAQLEADGERVYRASVLLPKGLLEEVAQRMGWSRGQVLEYVERVTRQELEERLAAELEELRRRWVEELVHGTGTGTPVGLGGAGR